MSNDIYVQSEFAPLKRVVLAQSEFAFSSEDVYEQQTHQGGYDFIPPEFEGVEVGHYLEDFKTAYPDKSQAWLEEKQQFLNILESYGVEVIRPRLLTKTEKKQGIDTEVGYSNFFTRDPFFTIGNKVIKGNLRLPHRKHEIDTIDDYLVEETEKKHVTYAHAKGYLEGGDVLVLGNVVFVGHSGLASDMRGIEWLTNFLGDEYKVVPVRLHHTILHLDCALSLVNSHLMLICEDAFLDGIPEELEEFTKIVLTLSQASQLMCNGLPINEDTYVTDSAFTELVDKIESYGVKVITTDYKISRMFGGSFRCTTQPLLRINAEID